MKFIGNRVFEYCPALTSVTCLATTPPGIWDENVFTVYGDLHVVKGYKEAYQEREVWKKFNIIDDMEGETAIHGVKGTDGERTIYNLSGQKLNSLQRGINILNGRKVLLK